MWVKHSHSWREETTTANGPTPAGFARPALRGHPSRSGRGEANGDSRAVANRCRSPLSTSGYALPTSCVRITGRCPKRPEGLKEFSQARKNLESSPSLDKNSPRRGRHKWCDVVGSVSPLRGLSRKNARIHQLPLVAIGARPLRGLDGNGLRPIRGPQVRRCG